MEQDSSQEQQTVHKLDSLGLRQLSVIWNKSIRVSTTQIGNTTIAVGEASSFWENLNVPKSIPPYCPKLFKNWDSLCRSGSLRTKTHLLRLPACRLTDPQDANSNLEPLGERCILYKQVGINSGVTLTETSDGLCIVSPVVIGLKAGITNPTPVFDIAGFSRSSRFHPPGIALVGKQVKHYLQIRPETVGSLVEFLREVERIEY